MKVLVLYDYPPAPGGLATQGDLLYHGLLEMGVEARAAHLKSDLEKEWHYRWFKPDAVVGVGFWGDYPEIVQHPRAFGMTAVPWLLADGYVANYRQELNGLPLILVTANWVKQTFERDGIRSDAMVVLPVGCDTGAFVPRSMDDPKVSAVRDMLGVAEDQLLLLTVGGDAASKGGREVMEALAQVRNEVPDFRYVCKVWPQPRTEVQNALDRDLAQTLGLSDRVSFPTHRVSRDLMPYLMAACDVYAAPSRLEGFGMPQVEAGACAKPVIGIGAMAMLDTLVHGETAFLAGVARKNTITQAVLGPAAGYPPGHIVHFDRPRVADYRASVPDIASALRRLLNDPPLRARMGAAGRASELQAAVNGPADQTDPGHPIQGLAIRGRPTYAMWSYKVLRDERCDLLGNSLAILTGLAPRSRARRMVAWIEAECAAMRRKRELASELPPCFFPFVLPTDSDWHPRYGSFNLPGDYHNGGIWPFVCGFYVAALVAAGRQRLARTKLRLLAELVTGARTAKVAFGFNEWHKAQTGAASGQDWQTWSAGMFLYAAACVEQDRPLFFQF